MQFPLYWSLRNIGRDVRDSFCITSYLCERFPALPFITVHWHCIAEEALAEVARARPTPHVVWRLQTDASLKLPQSEKKKVEYFVQHLDSSITFDSVYTHSSIDTRGGRVLCRGAEEPTER